MTWRFRRSLRFGPLDGGCPKANPFRNMNT
jgi:hypothetical protein